MKNSNVRTVVGFEVVRTLKSKAFWIGSFTAPLLILAVYGIAIASSMSGTQTIEDQAQTAFAFEYADASGIVQDNIATAMQGTKISDPAQGVEDVKSGKVEAFFAYPADPTKDPVTIAAADAGLIGSGKYDAVATGLLKASAATQVQSPTVLALLTGVISTTTTTYDNGEVSQGIGAAIVPAAFIVLFFMLVIVQGNRMLTATLEEKENRVTEMILTTISPTSLLVGKVIALIIIGLTQIVAMVAPVAILAFILAKMGKISSFDWSILVFDPTKMTFGVLLLLGGFFLFTATLVAIGAAMPTVKDAQGIFSAVIILAVMPIYVAMIVLTNPDSLIVQVFTFFPWTAPITAMARNALGTLPWWHGVIVVVLLFAATALMFRIAARLFQYGSVEYTKKLNLKVALGK
ncbi:MAG: ABC transporter permease [Propionibacteriaceae bacterium]|jgi:ABC-2 type transport system permease protein|nr:ABC transporter permease [Propionibacteriaceae bacterium]